MAELEIIRWILYAIGGGFIWFIQRNLNQTEARLTKLDAELSLVRSQYLHKDDFREFKTELKSMFEEIRADIRQINHKQQ
jgi:hypothetical protein